jgi:glycerol kinase
VDQTWEPRMDADERETLFGQWKKAVTRAFAWLD